MSTDSDHKPCAQMTLQDLDEAGRDVRAWCFACARGERIDTMIWQRFAARGWSTALDDAARRFRCKGCGSAADVGLFPIGRPPPRPNEGALIVEHWFHNLRRGHKRDKYDAIHARALAALIEGRKRT